MNCAECGHKAFSQHSGGVNRYYCLHPEAVAGVGSRMICRTERHTTELSIKTAPRWCPMKEAKK